MSADDPCFREVELTEEEDANWAVNSITQEEIGRRQWCMAAALGAYTLDVSENNLVRVADKIYEYVYGKKAL